ncbi:MAG: phosphoribosylpyrophosphate synthetase [Bacteroidetes bacterium]|nr:phosphoribosylpyrophosphate synthetase [Bacteroidota bacterium]
MPVYENLVEAVNDLKQRGFTTDFTLAFDTLQCKLTGTQLSPAEFEIVEHHRFEANTDPDDSSVLYAIQSKDGTKKGILISAYGVYADAASEEMIQKLIMHE